MVRTLLVRGMLVGLLAGVAAFLVGSFVGELQVDRAIEFEEANAPTEPEAHDDADHADHAAGSHIHDHGDEATVSRTLQKGPGLLTATLGYGLAVGGLFGLAYASTVGRLGRLRPRASAGLLALGGFVSVALVPFLKYPANPPAVGDPETVNGRSIYVFCFIAISVVLAVLTVRLGKALADRWGGWNASIVGSAAYVAAVVLIGWLMPVVNEVPAGFPAALLWDFRVASLVLQAALWVTLGLAFGYLTERAARPRATTTRPVANEIAS